jgi:hypothetical protein
MSHSALCELRLDPGFHKFGLSINGSPVLDAGALDLTRPGTLRGIHVDNAGLRAFGGVLFTISVALAGLLVPLSFASGRWGPDGTMLITSAIGGGTGLLVSLPFMAARSGLALRFE